MQKNFEDFSSQDILRLAKSPAGQQLMALLRENPQAMQEAQQNAESGQMEQAVRSLSQFLSDPKAKALLKKLQEDYHG